MKLLKIWKDLLNIKKIFNFFFKFLNIYFLFIINKINKKFNKKYFFYKFILYKKNFYIFKKYYLNLILIFFL